MYCMYAGQRPCDMEKLSQCCNDSQSCFLLLTLSLHLKLGYNLNDRYSMYTYDPD